MSAIMAVKAITAAEVADAGARADADGAGTRPVVRCRYCFNLDHWIPTDLPAVPRDCRRCAVCPMYVPLGEWEEHVAHGADTAASPVLACTECPVCGGIIPPDEPEVECAFCDRCQAYVPLTLWAAHATCGCYGQDDPFALA